MSLLAVLMTAWATQPAGAQSGWQVTVTTGRDRAICPVLATALRQGLLVLDPASIPPADAVETGYFDTGPRFFVRSQSAVRRIRWDYPPVRDESVSTLAVAGDVERARATVSLGGRPDVVHRWHEIRGRSEHVVMTGHDPRGFSPERYALAAPADLAADSRWLVEDGDADLVLVGGRTVMLQWQLGESGEANWNGIVAAGLMEASGRFHALCEMSMRRPH